MDEQIPDDDIDVYFAARDDEEAEDETSFDSLANDDDDVYMNSDQQDDSNDFLLSNEDTNEEQPQNETNNQRRTSYNISLTATHSYLGNNFEELGGRVVLEEDSIIKIPLLYLPGVVLIPGQLLPLQFHGSQLLETIKTIIDKDKIFGLVSDFNSDNYRNTYNNIKLESLGTVAEVRSYGTENNGSILKVKAEGRERFLIKEIWSERNQTAMGNVLILPEINLKHPFNKDIGLSSQGCKLNRRLIGACTSYPSFTYDLYDPEYLMEKIRSHLNQWASFSKGTNESSNVYENRSISHSSNQQQSNVNRTNDNSNSTNDNSNSTTETPSNNSNNNNNNTTTTTTTSTQPLSVNTTRTVVTRIVPVNEDDSESEEEDSEEHGFKSYAPTTAREFSYWVTSNLPLNDQQRLTLLSLDCPIQRLRWQNSFFAKSLSLSCARCNINICSCEDIFQMSANGVQDSYINEYGVIHDTLTLRKVRNITLRGKKCKEYSWFNGYSWIIACCSTCDNHLGWRFDSDSLLPSSFYGLARKNIKLGIENETKDWRPII